MERKRLWKFVMNPAVEVVVAIAIVLLAAWLVIATEADSKKPLFPVPGTQQ